jgi:hypothetical protein
MKRISHTILDTCVLEPGSVALVSANGWSIIGELREGTAEGTSGAVIEIAPLKVVNLWGSPNACGRSRVDVSCPTRGSVVHLEMVDTTAVFIWNAFAVHAAVILGELHGPRRHGVVAPALSLNEPRYLTHEQRKGEAYLIAIHDSTNLEPCIVTGIHTRRYIKGGAGRNVELVVEDVEATLQLIEAAEVGEPESSSLDAL